MAALPDVRFVFDFISPYAYLGWKRARRELEPRGIRVRPQGVLFAALLDANATKGPAEIPSKRLYTWKHVVRLAHGLDVPISPPPAHPFNPLLGLRIVAAIEDADARGRAVDALFDATWGGGDGVTDPTAVAGILDGVGLSGAALVQRATEPEIKAQVRAQTEHALAIGVFGVPSFVVDAEPQPEVFWGQDSVPHLMAYLQGSDPADGRVQVWAELPVQAARRGASG